LSVFLAGLLFASAIFAADPPGSITIPSRLLAIALTVSLLLLSAWVLWRPGVGPYACAAFAGFLGTLSFYGLAAVIGALQALMGDPTRQISADLAGMILLEATITSTAILLFVIGIRNGRRQKYSRDLASSSTRYSS